jgi:hypothetical protein
VNYYYSTGERIGGSHANFGTDPLSWSHTLLESSVFLHFKGQKTWFVDHRDCLLNRWDLVRNLGRYKIKKKWRSLFIYYFLNCPPLSLYDKEKKTFKKVSLFFSFLFSFFLYFILLCKTWGKLDVRTQGCGEIWGPKRGLVFNQPKVKLISTVPGDPLLFPATVRPNPSLASWFWWWPRSDDGWRRLRAVEDDDL